MHNKRLFRRLATIALLVVVALIATPTIGFAAIKDFPSSYQTSLLALQNKYPNWTFVPLQTKLDWNTVVSNQTVNGRSLVPTSFESAMKDPSRPNQVEPGWVNASAAGIKYYLDPRNFLDEKDIFQFELLSFNPEYHTQAGVWSLLNGSFMGSTHNVSYINTSGGTSTLPQSYSALVFNAGKNNLVNPYFLSSKILQEVGVSGSDSVTGWVPGYTGIYNFYNIGATAGSNPVVNGLSWARSGVTYGRPWNDPAKSINGGAQWISEGYIRIGQDSVYLQKWSVSPNTPASYLYWHQYMTNISGAVSEAQKMYTGYANLGFLAQPKVFYIPVYNNMPQYPCYRPSGFSDSDGSLYYLNASNVNVRRGPGTAYASYGSYPEGTTFLVRNFTYAVANGYTWAEVQFSNGSIGYVANAFLAKRSTPEPVITHQDDDARIVYTGTWHTASATAYSGGSLHYTNTADSRVYVKFKGGGIQWYGAKLPWGGQMHVWLNGVYKATIDTYASTASYRALMYSIDGLDKNQTHELLLVNTNARGSTVAATAAVDGFTVIDGELVP
jgi:beta-N-acetylglucosaminidase